MDKSPSPAVACVWDKYGDSLRRSDALRTDLNEAIAKMAKMPPAVDGVAVESLTELSPATMAYVDAINKAAEADATEDGGARLLGHLYCRYFADLFGGQALGGPYRWALGLAPESPRHYDFGDFGARRRESIELIY